MNIDKAKWSDIYFVLDNLCSESVEELTVIFDKIYKYRVCQQLGKIIGTKRCMVVKSDDNIPVALFGLLYDVRGDVVYFLPTDNLQKLNKFELIKKSIKQVNVWLKDCKVLIDYVYYKNLSVMKWIELLGFKEIEKIGEFFLYEKRGK